MHQPTTLRPAALAALFLTGAILPAEPPKTIVIDSRPPPAPEAPAGGGAVALSGGGSGSPTVRTIETITEAPYPVGGSGGASTTPRQYVVRGRFAIDDALIPAQIMPPPLRIEVIREDTGQVVAGFMLAMARTAANTARVTEMEWATGSGSASRTIAEFPMDNPSLHWSGHGTWNRPVLAAGAYRLRYRSGETWDASAGGGAGGAGATTGWSVFEGSIAAIGGGASGPIVVMAGTELKSGRPPQEPLPGGVQLLSPPAPAPAPGF